MPRRSEQDEIICKKQKIYTADNNDDDRDSEYYTEDEIEDEKYYFKIEDDIHQTHKEILDYVVDNNLDICEYMNLDFFKNFLIQNGIIE